ncbi:hypothetical protein [Methylobacterium nigriterrae]|uniref:hypothetical protein n=1 Tax=Methylobacterium nigriterrae TaxID=3127512 RepID=UPI003013461E
MLADPAPKTAPLAKARRAVAALIGLVGLLPSGPVGPARAETIGYRLEVVACRGDACRPLPAGRPDRSVGLYTCQSRAATLQQLADGLALKRPGGPWTVRVRCAAVTGLASA